MSDVLQYEDTNIYIARLTEDNVATILMLYQQVLPASRGVLCGVFDFSQLGEFDSETFINNFRVFQRMQPKPHFFAFVGGKTVESIGRVLAQEDIQVPVFEELSGALSYGQLKIDTTIIKDNLKHPQTAPLEETIVIPSHDLGSETVSEDPPPIHQAIPIPQGAILHVVSKQNNQSMSLIPQGVMVLGRRSQAERPDIDLTMWGGANHGVSRKHAQLIVGDEDNVLYVEDLDSANGTFLNGVRLKPRKQYPLQDDDEIRLGAFKLMIYIRSTSDELPSLP